MKASKLFFALIILIISLPISNIKAIVKEDPIVIMGNDVVKEDPIVIMGNDVVKEDPIVIMG